MKMFERLFGKGGNGREVSCDRFGLPVVEKTPPLPPLPVIKSTFAYTTDGLCIMTPVFVHMGSKFKDINTVDRWYEIICNMVPASAHEQMLVAAVKVALDDDHLEHFKAAYPALFEARERYYEKLRGVPASKGAI